MKNYFISNLFVVFAFVAIFASCTETIELDLNTDNNIRLVVDAELSTETKAHLVKLNLTKDYFKEGESDAAENAIVSISNGTDTETLEELTPGHYYTSEGFYGEENETYTLRIEYGGEVYTSTSTIYPVMPIDSISYEIFETVEGGFDDDEEEEDPDYSLYAFFQEPATPNQYYLFKHTINHKPSEDILDWFFTEDILVNGNYIADADFFDFDAEIGDTVTFEAYSISEEGYEYLNAILLETEFRGGLFDGAPANVPSNMSNGALGSFITVDVERSSLIIED